VFQFTNAIIILTQFNLATGVLCIFYVIVVFMNT